MSSLSFAQDLSPSVLANTDFILQGNLPSYSRVINNDVSVQPVDSLTLLWMNKDASNNYLGGYELDLTTGDTIYWTGVVTGNMNEVTLASDSFTMVENVYKDAMGKDTLIQTFVDTSGDGQLDLVQEMELVPGAIGLDTITIFFYEGQIRTPYLTYSASRDSLTQRVDTVKANIIFSGFSFVVQRLDFHYGSTGLDSINLIDPINDEVVEQIQIDQNSAGQIASFTIHERDSAGAPWEAYDYYLYDNPNGVSLPEVKKQALRFFPNPAQQWLKVQKAGQADLALYRLDGSLVRSWTGQNLQERIDLSDIPSGLYLLQVTQDGQQLQAKVQVR